MCFELNEAVDALSSTIAFVRSSDFDEQSDMALAVGLWDVRSHLCLAWNCRWMGPIERGAQEQEEYECMANTIPNWGSCFRLEKFGERDPSMDSSEKLVTGRERIARFLAAAGDMLRRAMSNIEASGAGATEVAYLEKSLERVVKQLSLAWHVRRMSERDLASLDPEAMERLATTLPSWDPRVRLVPITWNSRYLS